MSVRALVVAILLTAVACSGGRASPSPTPTATQLTAEEANKPAVEITYPAEGGDPLTSGDVLVALTVRSFSIVDPKDAKDPETQGHVVYYLDVDPLPTGDDATDVPQGAGRAKASSQTSHTWKDVAAGRHTLGVQLVTQDDAPLDPPVTDAIEIVVAG